jgi:hypothetical protein
MVEMRNENETLKYGANGGMQRDVKKWWKWGNEREL